jgi:hypothetical protein
MSKDSTNGPTPWIEFQPMIDYKMALPFHIRRIKDRPCVGELTGRIS